MANTSYFESALDEYNAAVFKWGMYILAASAACAAINYTTLKLLGCYPMVDMRIIIALDIIDALFIISGIWYVRASSKNGTVPLSRRRFGYATSVFAIVFQWNYLLYFIPSHVFWGFFFFFLCLIAFPLDLRLLLATAALLFVSLAIALPVTGALALPVTDELFIADASCLVVCVALSVADLAVLVHFVRRHLVGALSYSVEHDPLTGVGNRTALKKLKERLQSQVAPIGVAILDIDDYKKVNDDYGHEAGDKTLVRVAQAIRGSVRPTDPVIRYGGDEFVILFLHFDPSNLDTIEKKFSGIAHQLEHPPEGELAVSISMGFSAVQDGDMDEAFRKADIALYESKHNGKGRCTIKL